jgi:hypothetical protein
MIRDANAIAFILVDASAKVHWTVDSRHLIQGKRIKTVAVGVWLRCPMEMTEDQKSDSSWGSRSASTPKGVSLRIVPDVLSAVQRGFEFSIRLCVSEFLFPSPLELRLSKLFRHIEVTGVPL